MLNCGQNARTKSLDLLEAWFTSLVHAKCRVNIIYGRKVFDLLTVFLLFFVARFKTFRMQSMQ